MALTFLFKGMLMGLLGSIPLGPIGVLCIQRTLSKKFRSGFFPVWGRLLLTRYLQWWLSFSSR